MSITGKVYIGIDFGKGGGFCVLTESKKILYRCAMPLVGKEIDHDKILKILQFFRKRFSMVHVVVERLHALNKGTAKTNWSLAYQTGLVTGFVRATRIGYTPVMPKAWQKEVWEGTPIHYKIVKYKDNNGKPATKEVVDTKKTSLVSALRLMPTESFLKNSQCRVAHDGMVDAYLLAEYGRRKNL